MSRRKNQALARAGQRPERVPSSVIQFRPAENDDTQTHDEAALILQHQRFVASAKEAMTRAVMERRARGATFTGVVLFVSDHSHDAGVAAAMDGRDPRRGTVEFLSLEAAAGVAGFFGGEVMATIMREPPSAGFPLLTIYQQRVSVGCYAEGDLPGSLPDVHVLDAEIASKMSQQPSEALFEQLVSSDPARLLAYLSAPDLDPTLLTFAAEIAGRIPDDAAVAALVPLLDHAKPYVREGAIYGLALHLTDLRARAALSRAAADDAEAIVRAIATEQLAEASAE